MPLHCRVANDLAADQAAACMKAAMAYEQLMTLQQVRQNTRFTAVFSKPPEIPVEAGEAPESMGRINANLDLRLSKGKSGLEAKFARKATSWRARSPWAWGCFQCRH